MEHKKQLIVTIVERGLASEVIRVTQKAGAVGGTVINGRGSSIYQPREIFGFPIEPEKEIILTVVAVNQVAAVIDAICENLKIEEEGKGIAFAIELETVIGLEP